MADLTALNLLITANTANVEAGLDRTSRELAKTAMAAQKVDSSIAQAGKSSNTAAFALSNLGRVAQDAPFGFIAIQNNLNPLLEGFQRLQAEATATGTRVLPLLVKSLTGAGGIGLALSAITAAVTFAQIGFRAWTGSIKKSKEAVDDFGKSAAGEIANLKLLYDAATNVNNSMAIRNKAADELQTKYPGILKNISNEAILTGQATAAIDKLNAALIQKAYYEAASAQVSKLAGQSLKIDKEKGEILQQQLDIAVALNNEQKKSASDADSKEAKGLNVFVLKGQYNDLNRALGENAKKQADVNKQIDFYLTQASRFAAAKISLDPDPNGKTHEKLKKIASDFNLVDTNIKNIPKKFIDAIGKETGDNLNKIIEKSADDIKPGVTVLAKSFSNTFEDVLNDTLNNAIKDAFVSIGESIGKGENPLQGLLNVLGNAIETLGKKMIEMAPIVATIKLSLKTLNPIALLAGGVALVALGAALENAVPKFATGGVITRPTLLIAGEAGPERIQPLNQINGNSGGVSLPERIELFARGNNLHTVLVREANGRYYTQ